MKREQLSDIIGAIDDRQIAEAYRFDPALCGRSPERIGNMKAKRIVTLALAAALILALGVGAYAVYNRRVQDLVMKAPEPEADVEIVGGEENIAVVAEGEIALVDENGDPLPAPEPEAEEPQAVPYDPLSGDTDQISLQGFAGSPEYQAALAWAESLHSYDRDGAELKKVGNQPTGFEEKYSYNGYHVYTQAMADKIDEISAQYGLALHTGGMQAATVAELEARFGDFLSTYNYGGYYYADGTFQSDCEQGGISFQLRRCMKGTLDTVLLNITDAEQYEQWEYETASGVTVLLALGPDKALILADLDENFVAVNVLGGTAAPEPGTEDEFAPSPMTAERLQALADSIDFSIL